VVWNSEGALYVTFWRSGSVCGNDAGVDEEAKKYWLEQHVAAERIFAIPG